MSEDGSVITSDPGFGIRKGGWGFPEPQPEPTTTVEGEEQSPLPDLSADNFSDWVNAAEDMLRDLNNEDINEALNALNAQDPDGVEFDPNLPNTIFGEFDPNNGETTLGPANLGDNYEATNTLLHEAYHAWNENEFDNGASDNDNDGIADTIDPVIDEANPNDEEVLAEAFALDHNPLSP